MAIAMALLAACTISTLIALVVAFLVSNYLYRATVGEIVGQVKTALPQAETLVTQLKSEAGRARALLRNHAKKTNTPDDDDLLHALNHPLARGLLSGLGIDPERLASGAPEELAKLKEYATGATNPQSAKLL